MWVTISLGEGCGVVQWGCTVGSSGSCDSRVPGVLSCTHRSRGLDRTIGLKR